MIIREMVPEDAGAASVLEKEIFSDAWSEKGIADELQDELYKGYIAYAGPEEQGDVFCSSGDDKTSHGVAGYVLVRMVAGEGEILRIGVRHAFRRRGIARRLLDEVFRRHDKPAKQQFREDLEPAKQRFREDLEPAKQRFREDLEPAKQRFREDLEPAEQRFREDLGSVGQWFLEVREQNAAAIGLYRSFGFSEIGLRKAYYRDTGEAAVLMRRDVPAAHQNLCTRTCALEPFR